MTSPNGNRPSSPTPEQEINNKVKKLSDFYNNEIGLRTSLIGKVNHELRVLIEAVKSSKLKFDTFSDEWLSQIVNWRNSILSIMGLIATGAICISSSVTILQPFLITIVIAAVIAASATIDNHFFS